MLTVGLTIGGTSTESQCSPRSLHTPEQYTKRSSHNRARRRSDCPICDKYGNGPCGSFFWKWLDCTEKYPDDCATERCKEEFSLFKQCADKHLADDSMFADKDEGTAVVWERFVDEELSSTPHLEFPDMLKPRVIHTKDSGEISFVDNDGSRSLLAGIVQRNDNKKDVISAAASPDMMDRQNFKILSFTKPSNVDGIRVFAVYENDDEKVEVFKLSIKF